MDETFGYSVGDSVKINWVIKPYVREHGSYRSKELSPEDIGGKDQIFRIHSIRRLDKCALGDALLNVVLESDRIFCRLVTHCVCLIKASDEQYTKTLATPLKKGAEVQINWTSRPSVFYFANGKPDTLVWSGHNLSADVFIVEYSHVHDNVPYIVIRNKDYPNTMWATKAENLVIVPEHIPTVADVKKLMRGSFDLREAVRIDWSSCPNVMEYLDNYGDRALITSNHQYAGDIFTTGYLYGCGGDIYRIINHSDFPYNNTAWLVKEEALCRVSDWNSISNQPHEIMEKEETIMAEKALKFILIETINPKVSRRMAERDLKVGDVLAIREEEIHQDEDTGQEVTYYNVRYPSPASIEMCGPCHDFTSNDCTVKEVGITEWVAACQNVKRALMKQQEEAYNKEVAASTEMLKELDKQRDFLLFMKMTHVDPFLYREYTYAKTLGIQITGPEQIIALAKINGHTPAMR